MPWIPAAISAAASVAQALTPKNNGNASTAMPASPVTSKEWEAGLAGNNAALAQQQAFLQQLQAQNGLANQSNVFGQQQNLANMILQSAQGNGPNPALAQLRQATGQNVAQTAALMGGQRGVSQNAGLLARNIGNMSAQQQQNMAGQAATLQAQQQLAAQGLLGNQLANMGSLAGQQVGQLQAQTNTNQQATQNNLNTFLNSMGNHAATQAGLQANANTTNQLVANQNAQLQNNAIGGALNGAGAALGSFFGGSAKPQNWGSGGIDSSGQPIGDAQQALAHGGMVHGPRSNCGKYMASGGVVPGKAQVQGDSYANDKVHAVLSPGEVVIPRSVMQSADPVKAAADFVRACLAKGNK